MCPRAEGPLRAVASGRLTGLSDSRWGSTLSQRAEESSLSLSGCLLDFCNLPRVSFYGRQALQLTIVLPWYGVIDGLLYWVADSLEVGVGEHKMDGSLGSASLIWDLIISRSLRLFSAGRNKFAHTSTTKFQCVESVSLSVSQPVA